MLSKHAGKKERITYSSKRSKKLEKKLTYDFISWTTIVFKKEFAFFYYVKYTFERMKNWKLSWGKILTVEIIFLVSKHLTLFIFEK